MMTFCLSDQLMRATRLSQRSTFRTTRQVAVDPVVTARGNNVYVAWADVPPGAESNKLDIYLKTSVDSGVSFDPSLLKNVSETIAVLSRAPRVAATDAMLSVYWGESLPTGIGTGTQRDIFFSSLELSIPVPPPSMLSLSPGAGMQTQSVDVDLTGSGFQSGATLALSGTGVTVTDVAFVSPTSMKAKMNVSLTATPGGRDLTVTNPDGQSATLSGAFTVMSASALMLIEITRTDVNMGAGNGGLLAAAAAIPAIATTRACSPTWRMPRKHCCNSLPTWRQPSIRWTRSTSRLAIWRRERNPRSPRRCTRLSTTTTPWSWVASEELSSRRSRSLASQ